MKPEVIQEDEEGSCWKDITVVLKTSRARSMTRSPFSMRRKLPFTRLIRVR